MKKHRLRGWLSSFFGSHMHSESFEQEKKDVEMNVENILNLITEQKEGNSFQIATNAPELAAFVEDLYKRYTSLYDSYDYLTGELRKKAHHGDKTDGSSSSSSSSDSESERSSMKKGKNREQRKDEAGEWMISESEYQTLMQQIGSERESHMLLQTENLDLKQELDTANQCVADLNQRLRTIDDEQKNFLMLEKQKAEEIERLRTEYEQLKEENSKLHVEYEAFKLQADAALQQLADLDQRLITANKEKDALFLEAGLLKDDNSKLFSENEGLKVELESANLEVTNINQILQVTNTEKENLVLRNMEIVGKLQEAEKIIEEHDTIMRLSKEKIFELQAENDNLKFKTEAAIQDVSELKQLLISSKNENDALTSANVAFLCKVQQEEKTIEELKIKAEQLKGDVSKLEANNEDLKLELEVVKQHMSELEQTLHRTEEQRDELALEKSAASNRLLQMEIDIENLKNELHVVRTGLQDQVLDLEGRLEEKRDELSTFQKKLEDARNEASDQNNALTLRLSETQLELDLSRTQTSELECHIVRKNDEAAENHIQIEKLNHEVTTKVLDYQIILKEREDSFNELDANYKQLEDEFNVLSEKLQNAEKKNEEMAEECQQMEAQLNDLQLELDKLRSQKSTLEDEIGRKNIEASEALVQMEKQNHELTCKISDLQRELTDQGHNFDELHTKHTLLSDQFEESCGKLHTAEKRMEEIVDENQKMVESKDGTIWEMQRVIEENEKEVETVREEIVGLRALVSKLEEDCEQLREMLDHLEKEKAEMLEEKEDLLQSKDGKIGVLQRTEAELKEEISKLEVQLRLSNRKLQITETEFEEKEENYLKMQHKSREDYKLLEVDTMKSSGRTFLLEKELLEIKEVAKSAMSNLNSGLYKLEQIVHRFEEKHNIILIGFSNWSEELQSMRHRAAAIINSKEEFRKEIHGLARKLEGKEAQIVMLTKDIKVLELKIGEKDEENKKLLERVFHLDKKTVELEQSVGEKEAKITGREEEKREAIRQLCLWMDHHRENYNHLRQVLMAMRGRNRRPTSRATS